MNGIKALQIQRIEKEMRMRLAVTIQKCNTLRGLVVNGDISIPAAKHAINNGLGQEPCFRYARLRKFIRFYDNGIEFPQMDNIKGEYNKNIDFFF
jgi:hypothetical protein